MSTHLYLSVLINIFLKNLRRAKSAPSISQMKWKLYQYGDSHAPIVLNDFSGNHIHDSNANHARLPSK